MRRKLERFAENQARHNVIEPGKEIYQTIKGCWHQEYFKNGHSITLELACGRGEYSVGLGRLYPQRNFIGVDIKGDRIWKGSTTAINEGLENVAFLRTRILEIENFFAPQEVSEIWVTFPDPRPRPRDEKRRLVHPRFLDMYRNISVPGGTFHLKTDNSSLFDYALEVLEQRQDIKELTYTWDLYHHPLLASQHGIRTKYEKKFNEEGHDIKYLRFKWK